jgi:hypothetical protein
MKKSLAHLNVSDGDTVTADLIPLAVTAGPLLYEDGATQTFDPDGATVYVENGSRTTGEWYLGTDGRFCSYWPPSYRACYELRWVVENGQVTGLRFTDGASVFAGRYQ